jgi:hypothetical protein
MMRKNGSLAQKIVARQGYQTRASQMFLILHRYSGCVASSSVSATPPLGPSQPISPSRLPAGAAQPVDAADGPALMATVVAARRSPSRNTVFTRPLASFVAHEFGISAPSKWY